MRTMTSATDSVDALGAAPREPWSSKPFGRILLIVGAPILGLTLFLFGWQAFVTIFDIPQYELPSPSDIVSHLFGDLSFYWRNAKTTVWEAFLGFTVAFLVAMFFASILAHSRFLERMSMPIVVLAQVTPLIAYAPAIVIWFGFGIPSKLVLTALIAKGISRRIALRRHMQNR